MSKSHNPCFYRSIPHNPYDSGGGRLGGSSGDGRRGDGGSCGGGGRGGGGGGRGRGGGGGSGRGGACGRTFNVLLDTQPFTTHPTFYYACNFLLHMHSFCYTYFLNSCSKTVIGFFRWSKEWENEFTGGSGHPGPRTRATRGRRPVPQVNPIENPPRILVKKPSKIDSGVGLRDRT